MLGTSHKFYRTADFSSLRLCAKIALDFIYLQMGAYKNHPKYHIFSKEKTWFSSGS
jgi:hypothetical protein